MSAFETPSPALSETCATQPMGRALRLLGDTPTLLIIVTLLHGTHRFGELRAGMGDISAKTLAQRLRLLETHGFLQRQAFAEIPPRVEYRLTEKGLALAGIVAAIKDFSERYLTDDQSAPSCEGEGTAPKNPPRNEEIHA